MHRYPVTVMDMGCPDPAELRQRKRYGREEYLQDLLACLIVGGNAPRWNQPVRASERGERFLRHVAQLTGLAMKAPDALFVNEFELPRLNEGEPSGWPDFAFYSNDELLIIELKAEPGSHRRGQLSYYDALARHHHRDKKRRLVYLTPPLRANAVHDPVATTHLLLTDVRGPLLEIWADAPEDERTMARFIGGFIDTLNTPPVVPAEPEKKPAASQLIAIAVETARDGQQRAADVEWGDPNLLEGVRLSVRDRLNKAGIPAQAWIWKQATSGGTPLTEAGARVGVELRFSKKTIKL